ncbi:UDP-glucose/GDP-mannose dehydrogenase family protein [Marispirochaeta sp.]|uniref:UDP-glucose dehydrogenase family protein n=1 Tax=Marispirochaeta sp. TaxID=2038653 RepID=UPI0029C87BBD|nr:UDP-glucose/GDP-mannose dehydrogenase family protein [Marispirochaeta sp.]
MAVNVCVVGTGYVGLIAAVGLSDFGNTVVGVDVDARKIESLNKGIPTIYEPGCVEYLRRNLESGRLKFSTDIGTAIAEAEVVFIAVGTPPKKDGSADLKYVEMVARSVAEHLAGYTVVVTKSTVPVGTNRWVAERIKAFNPNAIEGENFDVVSNPEFLREGKAIQDFFHPDRIVIGTQSPKAREVMEELYRALYLIQTPFVWCSLETAELIKYAANAFLAVKITFINQMANLAEAVNGDIHQIAKAMGMDGRISSKFLHPGPGYGGSCFPKDTRAIVSTGNEHGVDMSLIKSAVEANEAQKERMVDKLEALFEKAGTPGFKDKTVAVLGLAFKAETDDIRETPALNMVAGLLKKGAKVQAHDPKAIENFAREFEEVLYCASEFDAVKGADALVIMTEWNIYRNIDTERLKKLMKGRILLDTRNVLDAERVKEAGFLYQGVGRG